MIKNIALILAVASVFVLLTGCGQKQKKAEAEAAAAAAEQARADSIKQAQVMLTLETLPEEPLFDIVTNYGTIRIKLYSDTPLHRENFAKLALSGYYDGILFHRVINGFMIQGGDPLTKDPTLAASYGTGGPGYQVPAEILPNHKHIKGALAAARRGDTANPMRESSGSQFYLVQDEANCAQLDGAYTVFGETVDGIKTIDKIAAVQTDQRDRPLQDVQILKIIAVNE